MIPAPHKVEQVGPIWRVYLVAPTPEREWWLVVHNDQRWDGKIDG